MRYAHALTLCLLLALCAGCGWNRGSQATLNLQFSGNSMLHVAVLPRVLPDGTPAEPRTRALLAEIAEGGGSYTYVEKAVGDWRRLEDGTVREAGSDLLLVPGPAGVNALLTDRLSEDFGVETPMVLSLHGVSPVSVPLATPNPGRRQTR